MTTPTLETDRIILRPLMPTDAEDVFRWASDDRVTKYMLYSTHSDISVTREWLNSIDHNDDNKYDFGFVLKENNQLIGSGGLYYNTDEDVWTFGYNIHYDYWNKGLTTEITKEILRFAYDEIGARKFMSEHAVENPASGRVMEKCGMKFSHFSTMTKFDGSKTYDVKVYTMTLD